MECDRRALLVSTRKLRGDGAAMQSSAAGMRELASGRARENRKPRRTLSPEAAFCGENTRFYGGSDSTLSPRFFIVPPSRLQTAATP
jgi:hypothetical protein